MHTLNFFDRVFYKEGQHALPYVGGNETNPLCKCGFSFYIKLHMQPRTAIGGQFGHNNCDYHNTNSNHNRLNCSHSDNYRNKSCGSMYQLHLSTAHLFLIPTTLIKMVCILFATKTLPRLYKRGNVPTQLSSVS